MIFIIYYIKLFEYMLMLYNIKCFYYDKNGFILYLVIVNFIYYHTLVFNRKHVAQSCIRD